MYRALQQIGITLIPDYSPEAQGRSERVFRILQDRLPKELALAGITDMAAANQYLTAHFLPAYNQRFAVSAAEAGTASFRGWAHPSPRSYVCKRSGIVAKDNTVRYQGLSLQLSHRTRIGSIT